MNHHHPHQSDAHQGRALRSPVRFPVRTPSVRAVSEVLNYTGFGALTARPLAASSVGPLAISYPGGQLPPRSDVAALQAVLLRHGYASRWQDRGRLIALDPRDRPDAQRAVTLGHAIEHGDLEAVQDAAAALLDAGRTPALMLGGFLLEAGFRVVPAAEPEWVTVLPEGWADDEGERACARALTLRGWATRGVGDGIAMFDARPRA